jgi:hypothetical protein
MAEELDEPVDQTPITHEVFREMFFYFDSDGDAETLQGLVIYGNYLPSDPENLVAQRRVAVQFNQQQMQEGLTPEEKAAIGSIRRKMMNYARTQLT